jgi:hypothetical protein
LLRCWVNGVSASLAHTAVPTAGNIDRFSIGAGVAGASPAEGYILWPCLWSSRLSLAQIELLYYHTHPQRVQGESIVSLPDIGATVPWDPYLNFALTNVNASHPGPAPSWSLNLPSPVTIVGRSVQPAYRA